ncbi:MAG: Omp28-related outer membrane protein [Bacteroidales bacterium]
MKRVLLSFVLSVASISMFAQTIVDTVAHNKKVVLEEYTGIHCVYCPDGHKVANQIKAANPNDVFVINLHQGSYATAGAGEPNFKTLFGDALAGQTGLTGYPAGTINRHVFSPATATATSNRAQWPTFATAILALPSYANVGVTASANLQTGVLTVNVEAYYTANGVALNMLNVALIQNNVEGPQTGGSTYNPTQVLPNGNYNHGHMLRHLLTGQWGDSIKVTTQGTLVQRTYTYTLPTNINSVDLELGNLEVVAFIAEGKQEIITGAETKVNLTNFLNAKDISVESVNSVTEICDAKIQPTVKFKNLGSDTVTSASFTYSINGGTAITYNWTGSLLPYSSKEVLFPVISSFTVLASNSITIAVVNVNGIADQNTTNNSKTLSNILKTTNATTYSIGNVFTFVQDQYGSESTWKITDDATSTVIAQGGPYADLAASGTLSHTTNVAFTATGCYTVMVYDAYGDGINSGYGVGSYNLTNAANEVVVSSTGSFGKEERKVFNVTSLLIGIEENAELSKFSVTPNPATDKMQINFNLKESKTVDINIYNTLGTLVFSSNKGQLSIGNHTVNINVRDFAKGIYFMNLKAGENTIAKKIVIE